VATTKFDRAGRAGWFYLIRTIITHFARPAIGRIAGLDFLGADTRPPTKSTNLELVDSARLKKKKLFILDKV
jgi:hypothetical protein